MEILREALAQVCIVASARLQLYYMSLSKACGGGYISPTASR